MIRAKTAIELADYIEREMAKVRARNPGMVLADATADQMKMIIEALRRPPVLRTTAQG
jgi:hypothetical protein